MVPDQDAVESITSKIRLQVYKLSAVPLMSNSSANKTMSTPLTTFEKISNMKSFSNDLLPGISGSIFESKNKREFIKKKVTTKMKKIITITIFSLITVGMLFYVFLFAINQTDKNQNAWFTSFIIWLLIDILTFY